MIKEHYDNYISLKNMIVISLLLHIIVLSIIFFLPSLPSPRWTFGPVYSVHLVNFSEDFQGKKATSAISGEINETISTDRSSILKKHLDTTPSVPIKRIDIQKKQSGNVDRAIEDVRRKVVSSTSQPRQVGDAESNTKMNAYYTLIWSRIKGKWALPQGILPRENIDAIIQVRILRNGTVVDMSFEKKSGNRYFDESAIKAIKKASPFSPLPEWIKDNSIELGIRFHSSEFR